jgi:hypothetical protein
MMARREIICCAGSCRSALDSHDGLVSNETRSGGSTRSRWWVDPATNTEDDRDLRVSVGHRRRRLPAASAAAAATRGGEEPTFLPQNRLEREKEIRPLGNESRYDQGRFARAESG